MRKDQPMRRVEAYDDRGPSVLFGLTAHHEWMIENPHLIHGNGKHDEKCDHHKEITGQHGEDEERGHIGNQPGRDEI